MNVLEEFKMCLKCSKFTIKMGQQIMFLLRHPMLTLHICHTPNKSDFDKETSALTFDRVIITLLNQILLEAVVQRCVF